MQRISWRCFFSEQEIGILGSLGSSLSLFHTPLPAFTLTRLLPTWSSHVYLPTRISHQPPVPWTPPHQSVHSQPPSHAASGLWTTLPFWGFLSVGTVDGDGCLWRGALIKEYIRGYVNRQVLLCVSWFFRFSNWAKRSAFNPILFPPSTLISSLAMFQKKGNAE